MGLSLFVEIWLAKKSSIYQISPKALLYHLDKLKKGASVFNKGIEWLPGRESGLSLWFNKWHMKGPLRSLIKGPLNRGE